LTLPSTPNEVRKAVNVVRVQTPSQHRYDLFLRRFSEVFYSGSLNQTHLVS
jgi:hypothetical protein